MMLILAEWLRREEKYCEEEDNNKSIYINIILYKGSFGKKTFGSKLPLSKLFTVFPLVFVSSGNFFGIFPERLCYIDEKSVKAI